MKLSLSVNFITILVLFFANSLKAADGMPQFNAETFPSQLFWLVVTFSALYLVVSFVLLPRVRENLRLRNNKISNNIERAESIREDIEKMKKEYDTKITEAKYKAQEMMNKSIAKAKSDYTNNINILKKKMENSYTETEKKLTIYRESVEEDVLNTTTSLTTLIINRILNKNIPLSEIENSLKNKSGKG